MKKMKSVMWFILIKAKRPDVSTGLSVWLPSIATAVAEPATEDVVLARDRFPGNHKLH